MKNTRDIWYETYNQDPNNLIVPTMYGDGIGKEVVPVSNEIVDVAMKKAYGDSKKLTRVPVLGGDDAAAKYGTGLPKETLDQLDKYGIWNKGPLGTPIGEGISSYNVAMRQRYDLDIGVRPARQFPNVNSPLKHSEGIKAILLRQNTEGSYGGPNIFRDTEQAKYLTKLFREWGYHIEDETGFNIKIASKKYNEKIGRAAIEMAIEKGINRVTVFQKGNIHKATDGAFLFDIERIAKEMLGEKFMTFDEYRDNKRVIPEGKIVVDNYITDNALQQTIQNPQQFGIVVGVNETMDVLSDGFAALIGGLGVMGGANISSSTGVAMYEAVHGTGPDIAGQNIANPTSMLLSNVQLLSDFRFSEAEKIIMKALDDQYNSLRVTKDIYIKLDSEAKKMATMLGTREFAQEIIANILKS